VLLGRCSVVVVKGAEVEFTIKPPRELVLYLAHSLYLT
jgi:hypothetical protein